MTRLQVVIALGIIIVSVGFLAGWEYSLGLLAWIGIIGFLAYPILVAIGYPRKDYPAPPDPSEYDDEHPLINLNEYRRHRGRKTK